MDAVVFDCDGVLVDSERLQVAIDRLVYAELGWDASLDEIAERFVGKTGALFDAELRAVLPGLAIGWREPYEHLYERAMRDDLRAVDGVRDALQSIDVPAAVASNSDRRTLLQSLSTTSLLDHFDGRVVSAEDVAHPKPAPDVYLRAAALLGVAPTRCLAVEDSPTGVAAARAAGMRVLGYGGGLTPPDRLRDAGATVFTSMDELPALVASCSGGPPASGS
jgi:HAD superfamily hydrolase (TIGR01509 family)